MARDTNGTFTAAASAVNPAVTNEKISSSAFNALVQAIEDGLTDSLSRSGDGAMQADLDMDGNKVVGLAAGTANGDAVRFEQLTSGNGISNGGLAVMAAKTIKTNATAGSAQPTDETISTVLDYIGTTRGSLLYRGAAGWVLLPPGTLGQALQSQGEGADPQWVTGGTGDVVGPASSVDNEVALFSGTTGKLIKRSSLTATVVKAASGVLSDASAGTDYVAPGTTSNLTVGYTATSYNAGTKSSGTFTPDPALGGFQHAVNGGAHTLAPPASVCTMVIEYLNNGSAGTITTSGFTRVTGDPITTVNGSKFAFYITKTNSYSALNVVALQ